VRASTVMRIVETRAWPWTAAACIALTTMACGRVSEPAAAQADSAASTPATAATQTIDHLTPRRDSVGATPTRFEWTAAEGANHYTIGVWNEADTLIWRVHNVRGTSIDFPTDVKLEFGTYYWSVAAFRDDTGIAGSGLAAFVVVR
jgi:hypothetical protein